MELREQYVSDACRDIVRAAALLRKDLDRIFSSAGLTGPQYGILRQLDTYGSMPLSELGKRLWVSCGNVTGLVDKLVANGLVRRTRPRTDRRVILAELTEKGTGVIHELHPLHLKHLMRFTSGLDEAELRQLQGLLEKICPPRTPESCGLPEAGGE